jgi:diguanylate cyclase (GGDEF)-like protein/PAS domain S-box-containing protein
MGKTVRQEGGPLVLPPRWPRFDDRTLAVRGALTSPRGELSSMVAVRPSAVCELSWVLYRIKRAQQFGESTELCPGVGPSARLARQVTECWSDAARNFDELFVLAQWGGVLFETDPAIVFRRIPDILKTAALQDLALSSERPDERAAIERRLRRLATDTRLLAHYLDMLDKTWRIVEAEWRGAGQALVEKACRVWRARLDEGVALTAMLPPDHAIHQIGLLPLLEAGMAKHEVTITPVYFCLRGHLTDLPGVLSVGVAAVPPSVSNEYTSRGRAVATFAHVLANRRRAAILALLLDTPSSITEITKVTDVAESTIRYHIGVLRTTGIIEVAAGRPQRFRAVDTAVDGLFNEMSARIHRGHGRATRLHAENAAQGASFRAIFDSAPIAIIQFDLRGSCVSCNPQTQRIFGYSEKEMSQLRGAHLLAEKADRDVFEPFDETSGPLRRREVRLRRKDGGLFWSAVTLSVVCDENHVARFAYAMVEDLSDRRGAEDPVTGLPNRVIFTDQLQRMIGISEREKTNVAILVLDLDGFKKVNDALGHDSGDILLREVSNRLMAALRGVDLVARLGGDEFGVLPMGNASPGTALQIAGKLRSALRQPFDIDGRAVAIGASIGVAVSPLHGSTVAALMQRADEAMYASKRHGSGPRLWENSTSADIAPVVSQGRLELSEPCRRVGPGRS